MSARRWIVELDNWIRETGTTPEDVARASNHDPTHVRSILNDLESNPTLELYLDLARGSGAALALAPETTCDAVLSMLRRRFDQTGLTKAAFAERVGRDRSMISRLLTGKNKNPKLDLVDDVVVALGLSDDVRLAARSQQARTAAGAASSHGGARRSSAGPHFRVVNGDAEAGHQEERAGAQQGGSPPNDWREQVNDANERERRAEQKREAEYERARQAEQQREAAHARAEQTQRERDAEKNARIHAEDAMRRREYEHAQQLGQNRFGPGALLGMFGLGVATTGALAYFAYRAPKPPQ